LITHIDAFFKFCNVYVHEYMHLHAMQCMIFPLNMCYTSGKYLVWVLFFSHLLNTFNLNVIFAFIYYSKNFGFVPLPLSSHYTIIPHRPSPSPPSPPSLTVPHRPSPFYTVPHRLSPLKITLKRFQCFYSN
jgi:hypothetical protein